jgi:hypothetical protein
MSYQLFLHAGEADCFGRTWHTDRYIVLDENRQDLLGEHVPLDEAIKLCQPCCPLIVK